MLVLSSQWLSMLVDTGTGLGSGQSTGRVLPLRCANHGGDLRGETAPGRRRLMMQENFETMGPKATIVSIVRFPPRTTWTMRIVFNWAEGG